MSIPLLKVVGLLTLLKMCIGVPENLTAAELFARRQVKLTEKKEMIADIALLVIENPEENVSMF